MSFTARRQDLFAPNSPLRQIHCIGDSIMYGGGIGFDETIPVCLENALHQDFPADLFVCTNFGHEGWNAWNSLFHHQVLFKEKCCDLLVFSLCFNDADLLGSYGLTYVQTDPEKTSWTDKTLTNLFDLGMAELKRHVEQIQTNVLVLFFPPGVGCSDKESKYIEDVCAKYGLPFLNIKDISDTSISLPKELRVVSPADLHPSAQYVEIVTAFISKHIRKHDLLATSPRETNGVIDAIVAANEDMLRHETNPQSAFFWAHRALQAKSLTLPRALTDRQERLVARDKAKAMNQKLVKTWCAWQREISQEDNIKFATQVLSDHVNTIGNIRLHYIRLLEIGGTACLSTTSEGRAALFAKLMPLFEQSPPLTKATTDDLHRTLKDLESLADSFTPILTCLTRQPETSSDVLYFPKSNARQSTAAQSQNTFIEEIQTMSLQIVAYFNTLLETDPDSISDLLMAYFQSEVKILSGYIKKLRDSIQEGLQHFESELPVLIIQSNITVHTEHVDDELSNKYSIAARFSAITPASIANYFTQSVLVSTEQTRTYSLHHPFFARATVRLQLRYNFGVNEMTKYGFQIQKAVIKPVLIDGSTPEGSEKTLVITDPERRTITLTSFTMFD